MNKKQLNSFYEKTKHIEGWFSLEAARLINAIDDLQKNMNVKGDVFEIGVHHGKSSVLFANLLAPSEKLDICDVFDSQESNVSSSGKGSRTVFLENIKKYTNTKVANIHACISSELTTEKIGNNYRLFHVDGGHNKDEALFDLELAAKVLHEKGIIILDDPFRIEWPGVTEALIEFLNRNKDFRVIAVGFNKLLLSKKEIAPSYKAFLDEADNRKKNGLEYPFSYKILPFADAEIRIFYIHSKTNPDSIKEKVARRIIESKVYQWYKGNKSK